jgi:hypothetical protein
VQPVPAGIDQALHRRHIIDLLKRIVTVETMKIVDNLSELDLGS